MKLAIFALAFVAIYFTCFVQESSSLEIITNVPAIRRGGYGGYGWGGWGGGWGGGYYRRPVAMYPRRRFIGGYGGYGGYGGWRRPFYGGYRPYAYDFDDDSWEDDDYYRR